MFSSPSIPAPTVAQAGPAPPNPPMFGQAGQQKPSAKGSQAFSGSVIGSAPSGQQLAGAQLTGQQPQKTVLGA
jgi:hypothetical protein